MQGVDACHASTRRQRGYQRLRQIGAESAIVGRAQVEVALFTNSLSDTSLSFVCNPLVQYVVQHVMLRRADRACEYALSAHARALQISYSYSYSYGDVQ
jgi:hypothetical protein